MGDDLHQRHLDEAHRRVARSVEIIARQRDLIRRLEASGLDAFEAKRLLVLFEETLALMVAHRGLILRADRSADTCCRPM